MAGGADGAGLFGFAFAASLVFGMAALRSIVCWAKEERLKRRIERRGLQKVATGREKLDLARLGPGIQGLGIGVPAPKPGTTRNGSVCVRRKPIAVSMHDSPGWVRSSNNGMLHQGLYLLRIYLN